MRSKSINLYKFAFLIVKREIKNIVLVGSGNVASHLGLALKEAGIQIQQVFSRKLQHASILAKKLQADYTNDPNQIRTDADLYILSIKDDVIAEFANHSVFKGKFIVHTAGSISIDTFNGISNAYGVLYPFQTFSKNKKLDFEEVPVLVEGNNNINTSALMHLAKKITNNASVVNSEQRSALHISAVFACNFSNHMYAIAYHLLKENGLGFDLIKPLIKETAEKIKQVSPRDAQTGPAVRFDNRIVNQHLEALNSPVYKDIYALLSQSIQNEQTKQNEG